MSAFGTCCDELRDAMSAPNSTFRVEETDVLYLSVGFVETEDGPGWFDSAARFCPFCGVQLQTPEQILTKSQQK